MVSRETYVVNIAHHINRDESTTNSEEKKRKKNIERQTLPLILSVHGGRFNRLPFPFDKKDEDYPDHDP